MGYPGASDSMTYGPDPYRSPTKRPPSEAAREFVYAARPRAEQGAGSGGVLPVLILGGATCAVVLRLGLRTVGLVVVAVLAAWVAWVSWRQSRRQSGVVLRVTDGKLLVYPWRGASAASVVA